jgi:hypothetical protein
MRVPWTLAEPGMTLLLLSFATALLIVGWVTVARRLLLAWYLRALRSSDTEPAPEDAIVTYPLA